MAQLCFVIARYQLRYDTTVTQAQMREYIEPRYIPHLVLVCELFDDCWEYSLCYCGAWLYISTTISFHVGLYYLGKKGITCQKSFTNKYLASKWLCDCVTFPSFKRDFDCNDRQHDQVKYLQIMLLRPKSYLWIALFLMITQRVLKLFMLSLNCIFGQYFNTVTYWAHG